MGRVRNAKTRTTKNKSYKKSHDTKRRARDVIHKSLFSVAYNHTLPLHICY